MEKQINLTMTWDVDKDLEWFLPSLMNIFNEIEETIIYVRLLHGCTEVVTDNGFKYSSIYAINNSIDEFHITQLW